MSTPERRSNRAALSRRNPDSHHQHSPFRQAYRDTHSTDLFDASQIPSPSSRQSARHRKNFSQTRTLSGAYAAASARYPTMSEEDDIASALYTTGTPNRRRKQDVNPISPESNPPNELAEAYRQIDDAGNLADLEEPEDNDYFLRNQFRGSRSRGSSLGSTIRGNDLFTTSEADFLNDVGDESLRRTLTDHVKDEQRLKRATSSRSPVLSKHGTTALTSESLQRREEEDRAALKEDEDDEDLKPSLNLPTTWGTRAKYRRDWLRNIASQDEHEPGKAPEEATKASPPRFKLDVGPRANIPERISPRTRNFSSEFPTNTDNRLPLSDAPNKLYPEQQHEKQSEGDHIPNTPITYYKNSTFSKRSPTKRDSHDLLRKLSRAESPNVTPRLSDVRTPEASKLPDRRVYDKTPIVSGAYIDTPVTERVNHFPEHLSKDIIPSPGKQKEPAKSFEPKVSIIAEEPSTIGLQREKEREQERERERSIEREKELKDKERQETEKLEAEKKRQEEQRQKEAKQKNDSEKRVKPGHDKPDKPVKQKPPLIKPELPKSALDTVMQDFKVDKESLDVGDDTIESLQLMLDEQPNESKTEAENDAAVEKSILKKLELSSPAAGVDLDVFNAKLQSLAENINKVKKGLGGLEKHVDSISTSKNHTHSTHASENCETCRAHNDDCNYTTFLLPRLWRRQTDSRRPHLTRLGWCLIVLFVWSFAESKMADYYGHPFIANICERNCLLSDAPQFPFVIPTMLWRWSHLSEILAPLWMVMIALFRLVAQLLGYWDGYVDDVPLTLNWTGEIRIFGTPVSGIPAAATPSRGFFDFSQPKWHEPEQRNVPEPVPEMRIDPDDGRGDWADASMDDDEYV